MQINDVNKRVMTPAVGAMGKAPADNAASGQAARSKGGARLQSFFNKENKHVIST
jgi:hypothetical protein